MCGIAGAITRAPLAGGRLAACAAALSHRGPDAEGQFQAPLGDGHLALVHRRLAIIDLDPRSHQPFRRDGLALIFNGEIYNYLEVKADLTALGHRFTTASDTEVVLEAYRAWGHAAVDRFEGMWTIALHDADRDLLWLSRDRFGEKPLFVWQRPEGVYFASEVKGLAALAGTWPEVDRRQLRRFIVNGYKSLYKQPATWFAGVAELPAAHNMVLTGPEPGRAERYWRLVHRPEPMSLDDAVAGARERLERAMQIRLRADVPIAMCLSGGVDSSTLAAIAAHRFGQTLEAFSILDADERYDERDNLQANLAALGCAWHPIETTTHGFFDRLARQVALHDAPVATTTWYLHQFLLDAVARAGFKVSVAGTAADELFTGYYDHYGFWLAEQSGRPDFDRLLADWRGSYGRFVQNPLLKDPLSFAKTPGARGHMYLDAEVFNQLLVEPLDEPFFEKPLADSLLRRRMLNEIEEETVPVLLRQDDANAMSVSVENRSPYLDRPLAEFLFRVPGEHLIRDGYAKFLLRAAGDGIVPDQVRLDKRKRGFNANITALVDRSDPATVDWLMADSPLFEIVRRDRWEGFVTRDLHANSMSKALFSIVSSKAFLDCQADRTGTAGAAAA